jgi:hypothetical protein
VRLRDSGSRIGRVPSQKEEAMSSAILDTPRTPAVSRPLDHISRLARLGKAGRLARYRAGELSKADIAAWIANYPEEVPTVNGEFEWIARRLVDVE